MELKMEMMVVTLLGLLLVFPHPYVHGSASKVVEAITPSSQAHNELMKRKSLVRTAEYVQGRSVHTKPGYYKAFVTKKMDNNDELIGSAAGPSTINMDKSLSRLRAPPHMFGKPNLNVDYSGPQTHGPKHH